MNCSSPTKLTCKLRNFAIFIFFVYRMRSSCFLLLKFSWNILSSTFWNQVRRLKSRRYRYLVVNFREINESVGLGTKGSLARGVSLSNLQKLGRGRHRASKQFKLAELFNNKDLPRYLSTYCNNLTVCTYQFYLQGLTLPIL